MPIDPKKIAEWRALAGAFTARKAEYAALEQQRLKTGFAVTGYAEDAEIAAAGRLRLVAPEAIPALLAEREEREVELARLRAELDAWPATHEKLRRQDAESEQRARREIVDRFMRTHPEVDASQLRDDLLGERAQTEREDLLALLREVERNCTARDGYAICPICSPEFSPSPDPPDHKPECRLAALLGKGD